MPFLLAARAALGSVSARTWGIAALGIVAAVLWLSVAHWKAVDKRDRASAVTNAQSVHTLEHARAADDQAGLQRAADQSRRTQEDAALKESTDALPSQPLSPRQRARLVCLRDQRLARTAGRPVPACGGPAASAGAG